MDFFATGGFQQLFSDLNETYPLEQWMEFTGDKDGAQTLEAYDYCALAPTECSKPLILTCADDPLVLVMGPNDQTLLELEAEWCVIRADAPNRGSTNENNVSLQYSDSSAINERELQLSLDQLLRSPPADLLEYTCHDDAYATQAQSTVAEGSCSEDINNNSAYNKASKPSSVDASPLVELETAAFITREMAEWEEKFLDNYIEIPELIEFLPEKTPLCTEKCDHFLHESSKNLKLHRKARVAKRVSETTIVCHEERTAAGYPCTFGSCDKIYAKPAHLKAHLRRHMGEKPYTCDWPECTWKFSRSDELARHRRSHSGVKPYKCSYCMKCFARSDHLTKHRKVHERRLLAARKAGKAVDGVLPHSIFTVRPGRKRKNQIC